MPDSAFADNISARRLLGWDNQVLASRNSGRDKAFYGRVYKSFQAFVDEPFFSHLGGEDNRRQPNPLVMLYTDDRLVGLITPRGMWRGDLQPVKSSNPKAPLLKGAVERE